MKQFKLRNNEQSADNVIKAINRRTKRQSRMYSYVFIAIVLVVTCYILNAISVEEYDGYISHRDIKMRSVSNIAIVDYFVKPGDIVNEGDTLYSLLMIDWLEDRVNPFSSDLANDKKIDSDLRIAKYRSEIVEINNTIISLHSAINNIEKEIRSGVKTEDELVNLNLELSERIERSDHLRRAITAEYEMQSKYNYNISNSQSLISQSLSERRANFGEYGGALRYRVAYVDSKIIDIKATTGMITLEHEEVLTFQPIGHPSMTNSRINMVVDANKFEDIYDGMEVEVYAGGEFLCDANVSLLGVRMAEPYADFETLLDRSSAINGKLIVALKFKSDYTLPEKYYIHNYPVEIKFRIWEGDFKRYNPPSW